MTDPFLDYSILASDPSKLVCIHRILKKDPSYSLVCEPRKAILIVHLKEVSGVELEQLCKCSKNEGVFSQKKKR